MRGILADANITGHVERLFQIIEGDVWSEFWTGLGLRRATFSELNLAAETPDDELWQFCQENKLLLITANRRDKSDDSLESTIRQFNTEDCLPVLTLANSERVLLDRDYAETVVERLLETLVDINVLRGTGRLYLP